MAGLLGDDVPDAIIVEATAPGLVSAQISVPVSTDPADAVLAVAVASAGKAVHFD